MMEDILSRAGIKSEFDRVYVLDEDNTIIHAFDTDIIGSNAIDIVPFHDREKLRNFIEDTRSKQQAEIYFDVRRTDGIKLGKRVMIFVKQMSALITKASTFGLLVLSIFDYLNT